MKLPEFIAKWNRSKLSERSGSHEHFLDLCALFDHPTPAGSDPDGTEYTFERGVTKSGGGKGWADVWKRHYFAWEYKGKHNDLDEAYRQLLRYREDLENPPVLVVSDMDRFVVHTNFTNSIKTAYAFNLDQLAEPKNFEILRNVFADPAKLEPKKTPNDITKEVAERFATLADGIFGTLLERPLNHDKRSQIGAHFTGGGDILTLLEPVLMAPLR